MKSHTSLPKSRIEAFSDGVIAILITIMVFDLKAPILVGDIPVYSEILALLPKFLSYFISFILLSVMWVNHHQLFNLTGHIDLKILWLNMHLLFWMSLVPFITNFIGSSPFAWQASMIYGIVFCMIAAAFTCLRLYLVRHTLLLKETQKLEHRSRIYLNQVVMGSYAVASALSLVSVYCSWVIFFLTPVLYFIPQKVKINFTSSI